MITLYSRPCRFGPSSRHFDPRTGCLQASRSILPNLPFRLASQPAHPYSGCKESPCLRAAGHNDIWAGAGFQRAEWLKQSAHTPGEPGLTDVSCWEDVRGCAQSVQHDAFTCRYYHWEKFTVVKVICAHFPPHPERERESVRARVRVLLLLTAFI